MKIEPDLFKKSLNDPHLACTIYAIELLRKIDSIAFACATTPDKSVDITLAVNGVEIPFFDFVDRVNDNVTDRAQAIAKDILRNELYEIQTFLNNLESHIDAYTDKNGYP